MPTMDALEILAEEGRRQRRYSSGKCYQLLIRRFPNGEIRPSQDGRPVVKLVRKNYIATGWARRELKHLSNARNINHMRFR